MRRFNESLQNGKLMTTRCLSCQKVIWPPSEICPVCLSNNVEWNEVSQKGELIEFSQSFIASKPAIFGLVELSGNIRVLGRILCNDISELKNDMKVKLVKCGLENDDIFYEFQPM